MMNDPKYLRAPTIFEKFYESGAKIALVTAKDKLRTLLRQWFKNIMKKEQFVFLQRNQTKQQ